MGRMMSDMDFIIKAETVYMEEDAEGLPCHFCGDAAWFKQVRVWIKIGTERRKSDITLCSSCAGHLVKDMES